MVERWQYPLDVAASDLYQRKSFDMLLFFRYGASQLGSAVCNDSEHLQTFQSQRLLCICAVLWGHPDLGKPQTLHTSFHQVVPFTVCVGHHAST